MVGGHLAPFLYLSCEPSELSKWICYDYSTINIVVVIIIIIIIICIARNFRGAGQLQIQSVCAVIHNSSVNPLSVSRP